MSSPYWVSIVVLGLSVTSAVAQPGIVGNRSHDVRQTMQARKLLASDPELSHLNIGVIVTDRVAVLWGPVPSAEALFRAELTLRTMNVLVEIRNELFVSEPLETLRTPGKVDNPPSFLPELVPPKLPAEPNPLFNAPGHLTGQARSPALKKAPPEIQLLPTEALRVPMPNERRTDAGEKPREESDAERELSGAIRVLLHSKTSYKPVQFAIKEGRVYLQATNQDSDVLHEAARAIARFPNVEGVVLVEKATPR